MGMIMTAIMVTGYSGRNHDGVDDGNNDNGN